MSHEDELEAFKTEINLSEYAAGQGYHLDKKATSRNCAVMRAGSDKLVIIRNGNGHWVYFSVADETDNGSIIDFVQNRQNLNLGEVRKELRPWLGRAPLPQLRNKIGKAYLADLLPLSSDLGKVRAEFAAMHAIDGHHLYLEEERKISASLLSQERFSGRIYNDRYKNAVFPHFNREGICGYELRNYTFKGFAPSGKKGLWSSRVFETDQILVIGEATIDILSYAHLFRQEQARYVSTGGELSSMQLDLIKSAILKMPQKATIVVAVDNDDGGRKLAEKITAIFGEIGIQRRALRLHMPNGSGEDWNDVLRASSVDKPKIVYDAGDFTLE